MKFKHNVVGPDFGHADIVSFDFGRAEISLVIPQEPDSQLGFIASQNQTVLPDEPNNHWSTHPLGFRVFDLVSKSWSYVDERTELRVAINNFYLNLIELPEDMQEAVNSLSNQGFTEWLFQFFRTMAVDGDMSLLGTDRETQEMKRHSMPMSIEEIESYDNGVLSWPMLTIRIPQGEDDEDKYGPDYFIYIPLTERLFLYIDNSISMTSRNDSPISLSRSEIIQLKRDILMEVLANIRVTYTPEVLALINQKNKSTEQ